MHRRGEKRAVEVGRDWDNVPGRRLRIATACWYALICTWIKETKMHSYRKQWERKKLYKLKLSFVHIRFTAIHEGRKKETQFTWTWFQHEGRACCSCEAVATLIKLRGKLEPEIREEAMKCCCRSQLFLQRYIWFWVWLWIYLPEKNRLFDLLVSVILIRKLDGNKKSTF